MSSLRSALDELEVEDPASLPDSRVAEDFEEIERALRRLQARRARLLAQIDHRATWSPDGYLSTAAWLAGRFRMSWSAARTDVRIARALESMPRTRESLESGEVSSCQVRVLAAARAVHPEDFTASEELLVQAAQQHSVRELTRVVAYWTDAVDSERGLEPSERAWNERHLHVSPTLYGMIGMDGDLDPQTGETLITALGAVTDVEARSGETDFRTAAQRRADALGEVCRQWLDSAERSSVAGERPHVTLTVGLEALEGRTGRAEFDHTGPVAPEVARRIACDASISRVITKGRSEPLDVGRRTAVVPTALRRAVIVRDGDCAFPMCDRPHPWCDAHHVKHWADGGPTALHNLVLLCRRHHRVVHSGPIGVEMKDGRPVFRRDDGSILEDRAPP